MFVIGPPSGLDGIKRSQLARHARVFAINNVDAVQHIECAQCDVASIAERGGNNIKARCKRRAIWKWTIHASRKGLFIPDGKPQKVRDALNRLFTCTRQSDSLAGVRQLLRRVPV